MPNKKSKQEIHIQYMDVEKLKLFKENPKKHDLDEMGVSIGDRFGYVEPILMDENCGKVVSGHGRIETLLDMKKKEQKAPDRIKVKGKQWLVPVVRGISFKNENEARAYLVTANRLVEKGGHDDGKLVEILNSINRKSDLRGTGYKEKELNTMLQKLRKVKGIEGDIRFTEELLEEHNYIVFYFVNKIDWLRAKTIFNLKTVKALDSKDGYKKAGVGRVLAGPKLLKMLKGAK